MAEIGILPAVPRCPLWVIAAGLVAGDNHLHVRLAPKATKAGAADYKRTPTNE
jgi:hypothetical protein